MKTEEGPLTSWIIDAVVRDAFKVIVGPLAKSPTIDPFLDNVNGTTAFAVTSAVDIRYMVCIRIVSAVLVLYAAPPPVAL